MKIGIEKHETGKMSYTFCFFWYEISREEVPKLHLRVLVQTPIDLYQKIEYFRYNTWKHTRVGLQFVNPFQNLNFELTKRTSSSTHIFVAKQKYSYATCWGLDMSLTYFQKAHIWKSWQYMTFFL